MKKLKFALKVLALFFLFFATDVCLNSLNAQGDCIFNPYRSPESYTDCRSYYVSCGGYYIVRCDYGIGGCSPYGDCNYQ